MSHPRTAGFYWAKCLYAEARPNEPICLANSEWEVVCVIESSIEADGPEAFRVLVPGSDALKPVTSFDWGPGPLDPPESPKTKTGRTSIE
jgi:hypothetical protein